MPEITSNYEPTSRQQEAHDAPQRYKLYGGAVGGGKSRWLCEEVVDLCMQFPGNRAVIARYHLSDFKNSTLKTLFDEVLVRFPENFYNHNKAENTIRFDNGSEIIYMGMRVRAYKMTNPHKALLLIASFVLHS